MRKYCTTRPKDLYGQVLVVAVLAVCLRINTNVAAHLPSSQSIQVPMHQLPFESLELVAQQTRRHLEEANEPPNPFFQGCTICGNLNVPFLSEKILPFYNTTCQEFQDERFSFIPKNHNACNLALVYESHCCDQSSLAPRYECEDTVRDTLFNSNAYNSRTVPVPKGTRQLDIQLKLTHWYVENVDVTASTLRTLTNIDLKWNDPRLRWDASDATTCVSFIDVYASHDPEKSDIWVPVGIER